MAVESIINAFVAGRRIRDDKIRQQQEAEDRKLEQEGLALRLKHLKLEEKLQARTLAKQNLDLMQGLPEAQLTEGGVLPARGPGLVTPRKQVTIPGVDELGVEGLTVQPQSMEEVLAARAAEERRKILGTPREVGGRLVTPEGPDGKPVVHYEPPKEAKAVTFRNEVRLVDGRRRDILLGSDGKWYLPGADTPFSGKVEPVPEKTGDGDGTSKITAAQRNQAERWKFTQLDNLEQEYRDSHAPAGASGTTIQNADGSVISLGGASGRPKRSPMTPEELDTRKLQIENAYRLQVGLQPHMSLPPEWKGGKSTTPPAASATVASTSSPAPTTPAHAAAEPVSKSAGITVMAQGQPYVFDTQEQADAFLRDIEAATNGSNGAKTGTSSATSSSKSTTPGRSTESRPAPASRTPGYASAPGRGSASRPKAPPASTPQAVPGPSPSVKSQTTSTPTRPRREPVRLGKGTTSTPADSFRSVAEAARRAVDATKGAGSTVAGEVASRATGTHRLIAKINEDAKKHGGLKGLLAYVDANAEKLRNDGFRVEQYRKAIVARMRDE